MVAEIRPNAPAADHRYQDRRFAQCRIRLTLDQCANRGAGVAQSGGLPAE
jgi:hypothetical protein